MKLREYIKYLKQLEDKYSDFDVIYSRDDEGNDYHHITYEAALCKVDNLKSYYLEVDGFYRGDNKNNSAKEDECNAICIN